MRGLSRERLFHFQECTHQENDLRTSFPTRPWFFEIIVGARSNRVKRIGLVEKYLPVGTAARGFV